MTPPFDEVMIGSVVIFAIGTLVLMQVVPPIGAKHTLGRSVARYAHVDPDELEDAVEEEGKQTYLSVWGVVAIVAFGCLWRILLYSSFALKSAGFAGWVSFLASALPAMTIPFLNRWAMRWLLVHRLDRRFGVA